MRSGHEEEASMRTQKARERSEAAAAVWMGWSEAERGAAARAGCRLAMEDDPAEFDGLTIPDLRRWRWGDPVPVAVCGCRRATECEYRRGAPGEHPAAGQACEAVRSVCGRSGGRDRSLRGRAKPPRFKICL
jgi:hypothetical protein